MLKAGGTEVFGCHADNPPTWATSRPTGKSTSRSTTWTHRLAKGAVPGRQASMVEPTDIPDVGRFAILFDPQGAVFSIFKGS